MEILFFPLTRASFVEGGGGVVEELSIKYLRIHKIRNEKNKLLCVLNFGDSKQASFRILSN